MVSLQRFHPKLLDTLKGYSLSMFGADFSAGITVGVLALPLSMAFAMASGVSPAAGIWTGIVAGFCVAVFGGSKVQIGGPTGAFIPILYAIVVDHGLSNMLAATFLAGLILLMMGATRLGNLIRFIPITVVIGFTNGIGVVLVLSQIKDFLGMGGGALPAEFFARMGVLAGLLPTVNLYATGLAVGTVAIVAVWDLLSTRIRRLGALPSQLMGLLLGTGISVLLTLPVETIGSRFHGIPQGLPSFGFPLPELHSLGNLLMPAITIALLGAIESLLSARVVDPMIDDKHDPNQELMAQGIANMASPFFGGIAATGAIARTSTNVRSGGRSPVAGVVHSITLLVIVLVAAPLAAWVPIPVLAAIVVVTAVRMGVWHEFLRLRHFSWNYRIVLVATFLLTVLFNLNVAVEIGMLLACLFFIYRIQDLTSANSSMLKLRRGIQVYELTGSLFFGAVGKLEDQIEIARMDDLEVLVLNMHDVINIDTSGVDWLQGLHRALAKKGADLVLCHLREQPASLLRRSGFASQLGVNNLQMDLSMALARAREIQDGRE